MTPQIAQEYIGFMTHEKQLAKRTIEEYQRELCKYIEWCSIKNVVPLAATTNEVRSYARSLSENSLKASSVNRAISSLKTFYKWALMDGYALHNPAYNLITPKQPLRLPIYLNEEECKMLVESVGISAGVMALQKQVVILIYMYCGLRARELTGLLTKSVERDGNGTPMRLRVVGKGNKERIIPIPEPVRIPLNKWMNHRKQMHEWNYAKEYKRPSEYIKSAYLIPGLNGEEIHYTAMEDAVKTACEKAGVTVVSPHKLRHTFATNLSRNGVPLQIIQCLLGHTSIVTTQIYTHVTQIEIEKAVHDVFGN